MLIIPLCFFAFISLYNSIGSLAFPNHAPFTNTFTPSDALVICSSGTIYGSTYSYNAELFVGIVMCAIYPKLLTSPMLCPSGVSAVHRNPQVVPWSFRGAISSPLFSTGVLILRKWLKLAA